MIVLFVAASILFTVYVAVLNHFRRIPANAPPKVSDDIPITGALGFWTRRWDWMRLAQLRSPTGNFSYHAGPNTLVGLSGEQGRRLFFENKDLGFAEG
jgi:hypothetical protein